MRLLNLVYNKLPVRLSAWVTEWISRQNLLLVTFWRILMIMQLTWPIKRTKVVNFYRKRNVTGIFFMAMSCNRSYRWFWCRTRCSAGSVGRQDLMVWFLRVLSWVWHLYVSSCPYSWRNFTIDLSRRWGRGRSIWIAIDVFMYN